mmetsp:Transcript_1144/g.3445  ORF Transcript_1144/g.3445 Transcript_1144/m.3445 type:complete len:294 (+) Transcript_1144:917-1798(+)
MAAHAPVPAGTDALYLHIREASVREPIHVLLLSGEQHPHVREEAREPERGVHRPNQARSSALFDHTVCFLDSPLRLRPVFNASRRHISVEAVGIEGQVFSIALHDGDALQVRLAASLVQLIGALVHQRHVGRRHVLHDALCAESSSTSNVHNLEVRAVKLGGNESIISHVHRPVPRVHNVVINNGQILVEPFGLVLVLDHTRLKDAPALGSGGLRDAALPGCEVALPQSSCAEGWALALPQRSLRHTGPVRSLAAVHLLHSNLSEPGNADRTLNAGEHVALILQQGALGKGLG